MPKKNLVLLRKLYRRFLRLLPKHFNMAAIAAKTDCGIAMCITGHTLDLAGYKRKYVGAGDGDTDDYVWSTPDGRRIKRAMTVAQRLLGLSHEEAFDEEKGLFLRLDIKTPKQAAAAIAKLIDDEK